MDNTTSSAPEISKHKPWVKTSHWIISLSFLLLVFTGIEILMVHPRLYWGEVGNELTPAFLELPISRNYNHTDWEEKVPFLIEGMLWSLHNQIYTVHSPYGK